MTSPAYASCLNNLLPASACSFVLVNPPSFQAYPLFYLFPYPQPIFVQLFIAILAIAASALAWYLVSSGSGLLPSTMSAILGLGVGVGLLPNSASASSLSPLKRHTSKPLRRAAANTTLPQHSRLGGIQPTPSSSRLADDPSLDDPLHLAGHYPGLRNTGNTCFFNSTVQSLASVPALRQYLLHVVQDAERWDVPTPVTDATLELIQGELESSLVCDASWRSSS